MGSSGVAGKSSSIQSPRWTAVNSPLRVWNSAVSPAASCFVSQRTCALASVAWPQRVDLDGRREPPETPAPSRSRRKAVSREVHLLRALRIQASSRSPEGRDARRISENGGT